MSIVGTLLVTDPWRSGESSSTGETTMPGQLETAFPYEAARIGSPGGDVERTLVLIASPGHAPTSLGLVPEVQRAMEDVGRGTLDFSVRALGGVVDSQEQAEALLGFGADVVVWFEYVASETHATVTGHVEATYLPGRLTEDASYGTFDHARTGRVADLSDYSLQQQLANDLVFPVLFSIAYSEYRDPGAVWEGRAAIDLIEQALDALDESNDRYLKYESLGYDIQARLFMYEDDGRTEAIRRSDLALLSSRDPFTLDTRGNILDFYHEYPEAMVWYSEGLELDPSNTFLLLDRGRSAVRESMDHGDEGYLPTAIADLDRLLEEDPDSLSAKFWRGTAYFEMRDYGSAIPDFRDYVSSATDPSAQTLASLGFALEQTGDLGGANNYYTQAIDKNEGNAWALHRRALLRLGSDDLGAVSDLTRALEITGPDPWALTQRAQAFRNLGAEGLAAADELAATAAG